MPYDDDDNERVVFDTAEYDRRAKMPKRPTLYYNHPQKGKNWVKGYGKAKKTNYYQKLARGGYKNGFKRSTKKWNPNTSRKKVKHTNFAWKGHKYMPYKPINDPFRWEKSLPLQTLPKTATPTQTQRQPTQRDWSKKPYGFFGWTQVKAQADAENERMNRIVNNLKDEL